MTESDIECKEQDEEDKYEKWWKDFTKQCQELNDQCEDY